jgi:hypothetical protein
MNLIGSNKGMINGELTTVKVNEAIKMLLKIIEDTENKITKYTSTPVDLSYDGDYIDAVAGATVVFGDLVYLASADSRWELTDADAEATTKPKLGIVLSPGSDGSIIRILTRGTVTFAPWNWASVGDPLFVDTTAGDMNLTAPSGSGDCVRVVGHATASDSIDFSPSPDWRVLA